MDEKDGALGPGLHRSFEELTPVERGHRGMRLVAERLRWPPGVVDALIALEMSYPAWTTVYRGPDARRLPGAEPYAAWLAVSRWQYDPRLEARSLAELGEMVAAEDLVLATRPGRW